MSFFGYLFLFLFAWALGKYGLSGVIRFVYRTVRQIGSKVDELIEREEKAIRSAIKDE